MDELSRQLALFRAAIYNRALGLQSHFAIIYGSATRQSIWGRSMADTMPRCTAVALPDEWARLAPRGCTPDYPGVIQQGTQSEVLLSCTALTARIHCSGPRGSQHPSKLQGCTQLISHARATVVA